MNWPANQRLPAAIFVDFDNFYSTLRDDDFQSAGAFAVQPAGWLRWFENGLPGKLDNGQNRDLPGRHVFLNSRQFGRFAGPFQHVGFQLVDCLTLSDQGTTTAQLVMSIFDTLAAGQVGEFIVLSTKPDFAPVMARLRQYRRQTIVVTHEDAAPRYSGQCDVVLNSREFTSLALRSIKLPDDPDATLGSPPLVAERPEGGGRRPRRPKPAVISDVCRLLSDLVTRAPAAVSVDFLIHQVWTSRLGRDLQLANWAGYGDCALLVRQHLQQLPLVEKNGYVYDPDIHQAPGAR